MARSARNVIGVVLIGGLFALPTSPRTRAASPTPGGSASLGCFSHHHRKGYLRSPDRLRLPV